MKQYYSKATFEQKKYSKMQLLDFVSVWFFKA